MREPRRPKPESPADAVTPGVLSAMFGANELVQRTAWNSIPDEMSGRRLALAKWIASPENTLTAFDLGLGAHADFGDRDPRVAPCDGRRRS